MTGPGGTRAVQLALGLGLAAAAPAATTDWAPLAPGQVQVGGEIGRRVAVTVESNLLILAVDKDFLPPFR